MADPEIPEAAITAAAEVLRDRHEAKYPNPDRAALGIDRLPSTEFADLARAILTAATPHLTAPKRPRIVCWACGRDVVRRTDGTPVRHVRGDGRGGQCHGAHHRAPRRPVRYRQPSRPYRTPPWDTQP